MESPKTILVATDFSAPATAAKKVGLVVLGAHGRGRLARVLLGSVAEKVVRTAKHPVLVVPTKRN